MNFFSQTANEQNKISLSNNIDKFGLRKIDIEWNIKNKDLENYNELIKETIGTDGHLIKSDEDTILKNFYNHGIAGLPFMYY